MVRVLAAKSCEFTRDEIVSLIDAQARRAGHDLAFVLQQYTAGTLEDFGRLAEAYAFCDLLDEDDTAFQAG